MDALSNLLAHPAITTVGPWLIIFVVAFGPAILFRRWVKSLFATTRMRDASTLTTTATIAVATFAAILLLITFTMSYAALYEAATWLEDTSLTWLNDGDLRFLFPLGIDLVIVFFLVLDLLMEWKQARVFLNRAVVWFLSVCTVALNVFQGDGWLSYFTHAMPPLAVIVIAEGVALWVRHLANLTDPDAYLDRVPLGRFFAHPWSTLRVMRTMVAWRIKSYNKALELELLCQACWALLRAHYKGPIRARLRTPATVRWLLGAGMQPHTAYPLVVELVGSKHAFIPHTERALPPLRSMEAPEPQLTPEPDTPTPTPQDEPHAPTEPTPETPAATPPVEPKLGVTATVPVEFIVIDDPLDLIQYNPTPGPIPAQAPEPDPEPDPTPPTPTRPKTKTQPKPKVETEAPIDQDAIVREHYERLLEMINKGEATKDVFSSGKKIRAVLRVRNDLAMKVARMHRLSNSQGRRLALVNS